MMGEWIGGILEEVSGDCFDRSLGLSGEFRTLITDVCLEPNGEKSAFFRVCGEGFDCGFDVKVGGISGRGEKGWLTFEGYCGHTWRIKNKVDSRREILFRKF